MEDKPPILTVGLNPAIDRVIEVPGLRLGVHQTGREISRCAGGKAFNLTRVVTALNVACTATGFLGRDNESQFARLLGADRVVDRMVRLPGATRVNITLADPERGTETHIRDRGLAVGREDLDALAEVLQRQVRPGTVVVFSGSLPPGCGGADHNRLVGAANAAGGHVVVDSHGPAVAELAERIDLAAPNAAELAEWASEPTETAAQQLQAAEAVLGRAEAVLLSLGADGAMLIRPDLRLHAVVRGESIEPVNTVGCGDALLGAFLAGRVQGRSDRQALAEAVATATASAVTSLPATFDPSVRDRLRAQVRVRSL